MTVDYKTSVIIMTGNVTVTGVHGPGQFILFVNGTSTKKFVYGCRGGSMSILGYCAKWCIVIGEYLYGVSDEY